MKRLFFVCVLCACAKSAEQTPPQAASIPHVERAPAPPTEVENASRDAQLPQGVSARCKDVNSSTRLLLQSVPFDLDQSELTPRAQQVLEANVQCLKQAPAVSVVVEGHCDERGTTEYNLTLGEQRAGVVAKYLERMGIDRARMRSVSKGKSEPLCSASTEECWAQNRRVELK